MLKTIDKYVLRELVFPFFIAVGGFIVFIMLNLILQLSDFMIDKSIPLPIIIKMLLYKLPELLVLSLPVAVLFSVFLALGRLLHDQEIVAMQSAGYSLKRIVIPILIIGLLVGLFDLFINDRVAPWGNHQYQNIIRQMIYKGQTPKIRSDTFFKGIKNRFFYISHYDREKDIMENIMIYDLTGGFELEELSGKFPKVITAKRARWSGSKWHLEEGVIHKYDDQGDLQYKVRFESMEIEIGRDLQYFFAEERTPRSMSLSELKRKIKALKDSGLNYNNMLVEYHSKISIPLAAFIFALFGAPLSLMFGKRSKAIGIVIALLLVVMFQGTLLWSQTLGRRGIINPALSAWVPNLIFGIVGLILFFMMDRVNLADLWEKIRRMFPFVLVFLIFSFVVVTPMQAAKEPMVAPPIDLRADSITISEDLDKIEGSGNVNLTYEDNKIQAEQITITDISESIWEIEAEENVSFKNQELETQASRLKSVLKLSDKDKLISKKITLTDFSAKVNGKLRSPEFTVEGKLAELVFDQGIKRASIQIGAKFKLKGLNISATEIIIERNGKERKLAPEVQNISHRLSDMANSWQLEARENVLLEERKRTTRAQKLIIRFTWGEDQKLDILDLQLNEFAGSSPFINSEDKRQTIRYQSDKARLSYNQKEELELIDIRSGDFTTCLGCASLIEREAYSINADRVLIYSDRLLVAFDITLRVFGLPIFWYPMYIAPLKETRENPLFPEFGTSKSRGWYAKWRAPFFLKGNMQYGYLLLDYFNRFHELGTGIDLNYTIEKSKGRFHAYRLTRGKGEFLDLDLSHLVSITENLNLDLRVDYRNAFFEEEEDHKLLSRFNLVGTYEDWNWNLKMSRIHHMKKPEDDEQKYQILERVPEFSLFRKTTSDSLFNYSYGINWGQYREKRFSKEDFYSSARFNGWLDLNLKKISLYDQILNFNVPSIYRFSFYGDRNPRHVFGISPSISLNWPENLTTRIGYEFQMVAGKTPFDFDKMLTKDKVSLEVKLGWDKISANLTTGYGFIKDRFDPLQLSVLHKASSSSLIMSLDYDLNHSQLEKIVSKGTFTMGKISAKATAGYIFAKRKFEPLVIKTTLGKSFKLGLIYDPNRGYLTKTNAEVKLDMGEDWSILLNGEYDFTHLRWDKFQYGLIRKFCHNCCQVGFYATGDRIWLQAEINAFPIAKIKYSPTDERLIFGKE